MKKISFKKFVAQALLFTLLAGIAIVPGAKEVQAAPKQGKVNFSVINNDDDKQNVSLYIDGKTVDTLTAPSGITVNSRMSYPVDAGDHTLKIKWTDPDDNQAYSKDANVSVSSGQKSGCFLIIDLHEKQKTSSGSGTSSNGSSNNTNNSGNNTKNSNSSTDNNKSAAQKKAKVYFTIKNNDNSKLSVQTYLDGKDQGSLSIPSGSTSYYPAESFEVNEGTHTLNITWTDPDDGVTYKAEKSKSVSAGQDVSLDLNIDRHEKQKTSTGSGTSSSGSSNNTSNTNTTQNTKTLISFKVKNNDDESYSNSPIYTYINGKETDHVAIPSGQTAEWGGYEITPGKVDFKIKWQDPDDNVWYENQASATVAKGSKYVFELAVERHDKKVELPQTGKVYFVIKNKDDDKLTVAYLIDDVKKGEKAISPDQTFQTENIEVAPTKHTSKISWTDPDTNQSYQQTLSFYIDKGTSIAINLDTFRNEKALPKATLEIEPKNLGMKPGEKKVIKLNIQNKTKTRESYSLNISSNPLFAIIKPDNLSDMLKIDGGKSAIISLDVYSKPQAEQNKNYLFNIALTKKDTGEEIAKNDLNVNILYLNFSLPKPSVEVKIGNNKIADSVDIPINEEREFLFELKNQDTKISDNSKVNPYYLDVSLSSGLQVTSAKYLYSQGAAITAPEWKKIEPGSSISQASDISKATLKSTNLLYSLDGSKAFLYSNASVFVSLKVKAIKNTPQWIKYRASMRSAEILTGQNPFDTYVRWPESGEKDQQGWYANKINVRTEEIYKAELTDIVLHSAILVEQSLTGSIALGPRDESVRVGSEYVKFRIKNSGTKKDTYVISTPQNDLGRLQVYFGKYVAGLGLPKQKSYEFTLSPGQEYEVAMPIVTKNADVGSGYNIPVNIVSKSGQTISTNVVFMIVDDDTYAKGAFQNALLSTKNSASLIYNIFLGTDVDNLFFNNSATWISKAISAGNIITIFVSEEKILNAAVKIKVIATGGKVVFKELQMAKCIERAENKALTLAERQAAKDVYVKASQQAMEQAIGSSRANKLFSKISKSSKEELLKKVAAAADNFDSQRLQRSIETIETLSKKAENLDGFLAAEAYGKSYQDFFFTVERLQEIIPDMKVADYLELEHSLKQYGIGLEGSVDAILHRADGSKVLYEFKNSAIKNAEDGQYINVMDQIDKYTKLVKSGKLGNPEQTKFSIIGWVASDNLVAKDELMKKFGKAFTFQSVTAGLVKYFINLPNSNK